MVRPLSDGSNCTTCLLCDNQVVAVPKSGYYTTHEADGDDIALATKAWKIYKPGRSGAEVATMLGETKDFPRMVRSVRDRLRDLKSGSPKRVLTPRGLGSDYLTYVFGIAPLVRDLRKIYDTARNLDKALRQLARDNDKPVRRRGGVKTESNSAVTTGMGYYIYPILNGLYYPQAPTWTQTVEYQRKAWFSGQFRYHIPDVGTWQWKARATAALFGFSPTQSASVLWELTPWSWLLDWYANVGDIIDNSTMNAAENLVANYAFLMDHKRWQRRMTCSIAIKKAYNGSQPWHQGTSTTTTFRESKHRVASTPYGFGINLGDLSLKQMFILSALGLSRT